MTTIVVLLILAGVTVAVLTGENGLLAKAKLAKERYENAVQQENETLSDIEKLHSSRDDSATIAELRQEIETLKTQVGGNPAGTVISYMATTVPQGYLECNGQAVSRTTYSALFNIIGTTYGAGDGSTTFNLPDLRGEFLRGTGDNSHENQGDGENVGVHQDGTQHLMSGMESNNLGYIASTSSGSGEPLNYDNRFSDGTIRTFNSAGTASNTYKMYTSRPTNTSVLYCIKY